MLNIKSKMSDIDKKKLLSFCTRINKLDLEDIDAVKKHLNKVRLKSYRKIMLAYYYSYCVARNPDLGRLQGVPKTIKSIISFCEVSKRDAYDILNTLSFIDFIREKETDELNNRILEMI